LVEDFHFIKSILIEMDYRGLIKLEKWCITIPAATATFSDSASPYLFILITVFSEDFKFSVIPSASFPKTIASGVLTTEFSRQIEAIGEVPIIE
jgi:hypothetical protein